MKEAFKYGVIIGICVFAASLAIALIRTIADISIEIYKHRYDPPKGSMF